MRNLLSEVAAIKSDVEADRKMMCAPALPKRSDYEQTGRPGDDYNRRATVDDIQRLLANKGYQDHRPNQDKQHFTRVGKKEPEASGTLFFSNRVYHNFSDNDPHLKPNESYSPFGLYTELEHGGDYSKAARELAQRGYGDQRERTQSAKTPPTPATDETSVFNSYALNGRAAEMEAQMLEDKFILGRLAILGQSTVFYAKPNYGKTLIAFYELISKIKAGELNPDDVFYINADDNHKGLVYKLKLAERYGFKMLAPGYRGFKPEILQACLDTKDAMGKIIFLDTVKKFTDLMRKDKASEFGERVRQFVLRGGSAIMMAHTNKHRSDDGKLVFGGVSDLIDDADCAYMLDIVRDDPATGTRTVKFENLKNRGDVALEAFYKYNYLPGTPYYDRLDSVTEVSEAERKEVEQAARLDAMLEKNKPAIEAIKACIKDGITKKTDLIKEAADRSCISRRTILKALTDHEGNKPSKGHFWHATIGLKNTNTYALNYGVE